MAHDVYDFVDNRGRSVIGSWIAEEKLGRREVGVLNSKIDVLEVSGPDLAPGLLKGPINKERHIYKLVIHAGRMLRPMLCKGPFEMDTEFTLLLGALEKDGKLSVGASKATANREILLADRNRRMKHERY